LYDITTDEQSRPQIDAFPAAGLAAFAEARVALELAPWNGRPYNARRPESPMRTLTFGAHGEGSIVYLVLEDLRRVDILVVLPVVTRNGVERCSQGGVVVWPRGCSCW
jgi:hypothetical protein